MQNRLYEISWWVRGVVGWLVVGYFFGVVSWVFWLLLVLIFPNIRMVMYPRISQKISFKCLTY